ncbi:unnamed protein product [Toxocara canis]|uniref:Pecanex-like protein n=1 Tax=Toxocara canis TaxID=6265 RepID=A0A183V3X0_TOXCA|nr:unnamed protein product [Toxocara canis]
MMLSAGNRETVVDSHMSTPCEGVDASDCVQGNIIHRNESGSGDVSTVANDGSKTKRKHVVRIVARRTLPSRSARVSSFSALESGNGAIELPHMAFNKEGRITNQLPYLEPAEMLDSDTVHDFGASTSGSGGALMDDRVTAIETTNERHYLAHQLGDSVWPLLSQEAVDFSYAANVIVGMCQV